MTFTVDIHTWLMVIAYIVSKRSVYINYESNSERGGGYICSEQRSDITLTLDLT